MIGVLTALAFITAHTLTERLWRNQKQSLANQKSRPGLGMQWKPEAQ